MKFNVLCNELGINYEQSGSEQLELLKQWFQENVSRDVQMRGDEDEQFEQYRELITFYLNEFLPEAHHDFKNIRPKLKDEHMVFAAASKGFDLIILSLNPDATVINTPNSNGMTPLHSSATRGYFNTVHVLLSLGADASPLNRHQQYPLFSTLMLPILHDNELIQNKIKIFRLLRDTGNLDLKHQDDSGNTVLHQMAAHDFEVLIKEILETNIELAYIKNNHTHYPIHTAILNNQIQNVILLLKTKDVETLADSKGWVALHYAARYSGNEILQLCCDLSTNIDRTDELGRSALMLATSLGRLSTMKALIERGAQINLTDSQRFTVLHHAVQSCDLAVVSWLLDHTTVDINAEDADKHTPFYINEREGSPEIKAILLKHGAK